MEEAIAISRDSPRVHSLSRTSPSTDDTSTQPVSPGLGTRVRGFLFSYLPTLAKPKPVPAVADSRPGLPLPPPEVLGKARGPIATPVSKPAPKPTHPKELVHLQHAPQPPSRLPRLRAREQPRRLVELRRVSPPPESEPTHVDAAPRRSSSGSVKELVRSFEEIEKVGAGREVVGAQKQRQQSVGALRRAALVSGRPGWKF